ncbi:hypothetical protein ELD05_00220 [Caldicellulosiruptor changbaiensis]|uniref:Class I SAM-dependent methyltransferase n=1 Tax=Caldicellulosiruptor changbaiensis TaxID=1222016 RepID=A0A3T0D244_9FIRM|nr:hypothetical protein [Caldicellulosiruptor changbaiensis]AZT89235.1 hypothetical protein ELD05_00220 [Caldicellulosiruptor changbaiensis]
MCLLVYDVMRIAKENHSSVCVRYSNSFYQRKSTCEKCLPKVHFGRKNNSNVRDYDCKNMIYYYCGRYSLKHAGEIFMLLEQINSRLPDNPRILSVGCGPCTDLFGFEAYYRKYKPKSMIEYHGFEKSMLWNEVHRFIIQHGKKHKLARVEVTYMDAINEFHKIEDIMRCEKPNIISFQYVLSDMAKYYDVAFVKRFAEKFVVKAFDILPKSTMIIFNDTNVTQQYALRNPEEVKGREILDYLARKFWTNYNIAVLKYYFPYNSDLSLCFGCAHSKCDIDMESVPEELKNYFEMWNQYRSAQLVFVKNADVSLAKRG